jgi:ketosteroid isomerase-like protein
MARRWVQLLTSTMEEHASPADVDRLLEMYAEDAIYEHPHAGARIEGKVLMRAGMASHLGESRNPRIQINRITSGEDFAVAEFSLKMDVRQNDRWLAMQRRQVVVFELKNSHVQRIIDHWDRRR